MNILFEFYRGDTYQRDFTISGWSFPISKVFFTVKEDIEKKNHVLQKTLDNGITLVDEENGTNTFNLKICCTDTEHMKVDTDYVFDIEIHSYGLDGEILKKTILTGTLRLKGSATKRCNEC
jgi:hypothetical protein